MINAKEEYIERSDMDVELDREKFSPCPVCNCRDQLHLWVERENIGGQSPLDAYIAHIHCLNCHIDMQYYQVEIADKADLGGGITFGTVSRDKNRNLAIRNLCKRWNMIYNQKYM